MIGSGGNSVGSLADHIEAATALISKPDRGQEGQMPAGNAPSGEDASNGIYQASDVKGQAWHDGEGAPELGKGT